MGGGLPSLNRNARAGGQNPPPRQIQGVTANKRARGGAMSATECVDGRRDGSGGGVRGVVDIELVGNVAAGCASTGVALTAGVTAHTARVRS